MVAHKGDSVSHHYSPKATLLLREGPFNVVQSHWPRGSLSSLHRLTLHKLREVGLLDIGIAASASTSNSNPSSNSNENKKEKGKTAQPKLVVYLSRPKGERSLYQEDLLINLMRGMLKPGFVLEVVGKGEKKISYYTDQQKLLNQEAKLKELEESGAEVTTLQAVNNSTADTAETAWLSRAHLYARATAVVGVHGGAMATCAFLCPPNTTVIEINVPWIPALQDDNGESALARAASAGELKLKLKLKFKFKRCDITLFCWCLTSCLVVQFDSSGLLLSYPTMTNSMHVTIILISTIL